MPAFFKADESPTPQALTISSSSPELMETKVDISPENSITLLPLILFLVWIIGVVFILLFLLKKTLEFRNNRKNAEEITSKPIISILKIWSIKLRIRRRVRIYSGSSISTPCAAGIISPKIYLPLELIEKFSIQELEPIIAHELVHIKRFDIVFTCIQNLIHALYFFHPAVWIANSRINALREETCDARVLGISNIEPRFYSNVMLKVMQEKSGGNANRIKTSAHNPSCSHGDFLRRREVSRRIIRKIVVESSSCCVIKLSQDWVIWFIRFINSFDMILFPIW